MAASWHRSRAWRLASGSALALFLLMRLANLSHAEKPEWAGGGKKEHAERHGDKHGGKRDDRHERGGHDEVRVQLAPAPVQRGVQVDIRIGNYFGDQHRQVIHQAYAPQIQAGHCPPGLAKKGNGCLPPGQAKKAYMVGRPLPPGVVYYDLPPSVTVQLGTPPAGHRFVRVAADILLIAVGTGIVVDAIEDLSR